jgi:glycosyltransferase involved in cell wall biosynthesis
MGPVSTVILELTNRFVERGHEVILTDVAAKAPRDLLDKRVRLFELPGRAGSLIESESKNPAVRILREWSNSYRYVSALVSRANVDADVVHFHSPVPALIAQRLYGIRTAYTAHTPLWTLPQPTKGVVNGRTGKSFSPLARIPEFVERAVIRRSLVSVGLGGYVADSLPGANVATIPNGLDCKTWAPIDRASARANLGFLRDEFVVVFAGRILAEKGVDVLLQAVRLAAPSIPRLAVHLLGPLSGSFDTRDETVTDYAREMMKLARDLPVRFVGFVNNRTGNFRSYLAAADVFVLPSRREPQGLVVLEAMAMGTPVIGSATGGIPDMVSPDVGYLFPPGDAGALAACLERANADSEKLAAMRKNARSRVETLYSWDQAASRYLAAFHQATRNIGPTKFPLDEDQLKDKPA